MADKTVLDVMLCYLLCPVCALFCDTVRTYFCKAFLAHFTNEIAFTDYVLNMKVLAYNGTVGHAVK